MASVNWGGSTITTSTSQQVYVRRRWADPWVLIDALWCVERSWSLLPSIPTATLIFDYGRILPHGSFSWQTVQKLNIAGWYVKVVDTCADGGLSWIGYIDEVGDEQGGVIGTGPSSIATGRQVFVAYSIVQSLAHEIVTRTRWKDQESGVDRWAGSAGTFNANGKGNMVLATGSSASDNNYVFHFGHLAQSQGEFWNSRQIIRYLFNYAKPVDKDGAEKIKWRIDGIDLVPDWDKPTIDAEGRSVLQLLVDLVNPARMLQLSILLDESTNPDTVVLKVHSLAATDLTLPNGSTHPKNSSTLTIATTDAQDTYVSTQGSVSSRVDQVIVKGARRESVVTAKIVEAGQTGELLREMFSSTVVSTYEAAASGTANYSSLTSNERRRKNEMVRSREVVNDAYRVFTLNEKSNLLVGIQQLFVEDDESTRYYPWWGETRFQPRLPFKRGVDYSGGAIPADTHNDEAKPDDYRAPLVLFKKPSSSPEFYIRAEKLANVNNDPSFSMAVGLEYDGKCFTLDVQGAEQHAIAHGRFTALPDDRTTAELGSWTYLDAKCTFAIQDDRYVEGRWPLDTALPSGLDLIRRKIIYAGPAYRLIRVMSATAVDVDDDGALKEGGGTYLKDDREKLQSLAELAASWWLSTRKIFRLTSARPSAVPSVGQLITTINAGTSQADTINTVISEIRLSTPLAENGSPASATYTIATAMGELDALAFSPQPNSVDPGFQAIPADLVR